MDKHNMDLAKIKESLNSRFRNVSIHDVVDNSDGSVSLILSGGKDQLNTALSTLNMGDVTTLPEIDSADASRLKRMRLEKGSSIIRRDSLGGDYLDLSKKPSVLAASPQELYKRAMDYYKTEDVYGSSVDLMTNFASKGLRNDIDDPNIKDFFDNWSVDTGFDETVEQVFFEFFRSGFVRTYKIVGKYIPKINYISPIPGQKVKKISEDVASRYLDKICRDSTAETGAKKIKWSKDYIPIKYTVLNPTLIEVDKSSLLMDQQLIVLKGEALKDIKELLSVPSSNLTKYQQDILKNLPSDFKKAALAGEDLPLDPYLVGSVDYRRQPYELYPYPRGVRAFESMEYKRSLREADYSTLDGITNFILVITIGNDNFPVKTQDQLEAVADMFDTPSKAFNVVWDHTLSVKRIEPSDVGNILGQDKYRQVNDDITGAFGVIRALIDGVGSPSKAAADLAVKSLVEEIYYARKKVSRWIYAEYRDVAEAMGFDRYPKVRFDNMVLKDEILMMNIIQGMIDRRIISYRTGHELIGFDFGTLLSEMEYERDLVLDGTLGIIGSPYNPKALPPASQVQEEQRTPKGTPSEGRPKGKPAKKPEPPTKPKKPSVDAPTEESSLNVQSLLSDMSLSELEELLSIVRSVVISKVSGENTGE